MWYSDHPGRLEGQIVHSCTWCVLFPLSSKLPTGFIGQLNEFPSCSPDSVETVAISGGFLL